MTDPDDALPISHLAKNMIYHGDAFVLNTVFCLNKIYNFHEPPGHLRSVPGPERPWQWDAMRPVA